jgi:hypothetical protein
VATVSVRRMVSWMCGPKAWSQNGEWRALTVAASMEMGLRRREGWCASRRKGHKSSDAGGDAWRWAKPASPSTGEGEERLPRRPGNGVHPDVVRAPVPPRL